MEAFVGNSNGEAHSVRLFGSAPSSSHGHAPPPALWPFAARAPKAAGDGLHRIVRPEDTFERIRPYLSTVGVTRLADITGLDTVGIPVYSSIVPRSRDLISVYNGKGFHPIDAKTGAAMEAVERHVASRDRRPVEVGSFRAIRRRYDALDPATINLAPHPRYSDDTQLAWLEGIDLLSGRKTLVPHGLACFYGIGYPWQSCHAVTTSNGIASGNSLEEAACHALAEVIERDAHTIMDVVDRQILVVDSKAAGVRQTRVDRFLEERARVFPDIDIDSLPPRAEFLVSRFRAAGLEPCLRYAGCECGVTTIFCLVADEVAGSFSRAHHGVGTDPDPNVAVVRALTEAAQSRAADMQAMREDLTGVDETVPSFMLHAHRSGAADRGYWKKTGRTVPIHSLPGRATVDIVDDIRCMLAGVEAIGIKQCILVDLTLPDIPAAVVRVIVPGLENWVVDHTRLGHRARGYWRDFARRIQ